MASLQNDQGNGVTGDLSLVYVSTDGQAVYDLAAGDTPTDPAQRVRLRLALIDTLHRIALADDNQDATPAHPTQ